jgi:hypothetical protein
MVSSLTGVEALHSQLENVPHRVDIELTQVSLNAGF